MILLVHFKFYFERTFIFYFNWFHCILHLYIFHFSCFKFYFILKARQHQIIKYSSPFHFKINTSYIIKFYCVLVWSKIIKNKTKIRRSKLDFIVSKLRQKKRIINYVFIMLWNLVCLTSVEKKIIIARSERLWLGIQWCPN